MFDGDVRRVFLKLDSNSEGLYSSSGSYDRALNVLRAWRTERRVLREQSVRAGLKSVLKRSC